MAKIIIEGEAKEIAGLVGEIQSRQMKRSLTDKAEAEAKGMPQIIKPTNEGSADDGSGVMIDVHQMNQATTQRDRG